MLVPRSLHIFEVDEYIESFRRRRCNAWRTGFHGDKLPIDPSMKAVGQVFHFFIR
jgi:hypothetical protein